MTPFHAHTPDKPWPNPLCGTSGFERNDVISTKTFVEGLESAKRGHWSTHGDVAMISSLGFCWECASILGVDDMNIDWTKEY